MNKKIISLFVLMAVVGLQGISLGNDNFNFDPVMQSLDENRNYQSNYPLPNQNYEKPVNNIYEQPANYNYNTQGYSGNNYNVNQDKLRGNVVMVPAKTTFSAVLQTALSSETAKAGDGVVMFLGSDFYYGNTLIAPYGSRVHGSVVKAKKGGLGERNGQLQIKMTNIITPSGQIIPISASIQTDDGSGILKAGTKMDTTKEYAKKAAIGAASGAVLGVVMGALSQGKVGKGAIYGTAVGGGLGLIQPMFERGGNVDLPSNAQFELVLDQPVTVSANSSF